MYIYISYLNKCFMQTGQQINFDSLKSKRHGIYGQRKKIANKIYDLDN